MLLNNKSPTSEKRTKKTCQVPEYQPIVIKIICLYTYVCDFYILFSDMSRRRPWSDDEKRACKHFFNRWLRSATLPGKKQIEDIQSKTPCLQDRSWVQIKNCIRNLIKKNE